MICEFCGVHGDKESPAALDWRWFTGYLDRTVHFCPQCLVARAGTIRQFHARAMVRPEVGAHEIDARRVLLELVRIGELAS